MNSKSRCWEALNDIGHIIENCDDPRFYNYWRNQVIKMRDEMAEKDKEQKDHLRKGKWSR